MKKTNNKIKKSKMTIEKLAILTQQGFSNLDNRLVKVEDRLVKVEVDVRWMKENSGELFTKIDRFIYLYEEQRQELSVLIGQVRRLEDRVVKIEIKS